MKRKRLLALMLAAVMAVGLAGCGTQSSSSSAAAESSAAESSVAEESSAAESSVAEESSAAESTADASASQTTETPDFSAASPWIFSSVVGTLLPEEEQNLKDDFYQAVNYDYIASNQDVAVAAINLIQGSNSLPEKFLAYLTDESNQSDILTNMRLMFSQAVDYGSLETEGLQSVQKYLDMIDRAASLDELNAVLTSEEYPFDAFFCTNLTANGMDGNMIVSVSPHFFAVDDLTGAEKYKEYPLDFSSQTGSGVSILNNAGSAILGFYAMGYKTADMSLLADAIQFESAYGKNAPYNNETALAEYGTISSYYSYVTLDEMASHTGSFPIKEILAKQGRDGSSVYQVQDIVWLDDLASVYTEENLDVIKLALKLQLLKEVQPYTCLAYGDANASYQNDALTMKATAETDAPTNAYNALAAVSTYGHAIGSIYKYDIMSQTDYDRICTMTEDIIAEYKEIISENTWLDDSSKAAITAKLDNMTINVWEPASGFISCEGVTLKSTEEGGSLVDNYITLSQHYRAEVNKLINGASVAAAAWLLMSPTTGNAFYDPESNSINLLPGVMNDATYRSDMSDEELYGALGTTMGHEISHAFDYSGSQYNYNGKPENIISSDCLDTYLEKQQKIIDYYNTISYADTLPVDGRTLVTEACADLASMQVLHSLASKKDNFDYDTFYRADATIWAAVLTPAYVMLTITDTHPNNYLRTNVNLQMFDKFYETYDIQEGDGMYLAPEDRITVW